MDICEVRSMTDLINFFSDRDGYGNKNGKLEPNEFPEASSEKPITSSQAMEMVNRCGAKRIFTLQQISIIRSLNHSGKTFPSIKLAVDTRIQGSDWPAGVELNFADNGEISSWSKVINEKKSKIRIVCEGTFNAARLKQGAKIYGVNLAAGAAIWFDKENRVKGFTLTEDTQIGKHIYKAGTAVEFYPDGKLRYGVLAKEADLGPGLFPAGTEVAYDEIGKLMATRLPMNGKVEIQGKTFIGPKRITLKSDGFYVIRFYKNGSVLSGPVSNNYADKNKIKYYAYLSDNDSFSGTSCNITDTVFMSPPFYPVFHEDGTVKRGYVAENTIVDVKGIKLFFKKQSEIEYYENGIAKNGRLASKTDLYGISFDAGTLVEFDLDGKVVRIVTDKVVYDVGQDGKLKTSPRK